MFILMHFAEICALLIGDILVYGFLHTLLIHSCLCWYCIYLVEQGITSYGIFLGSIVLCQFLLYPGQYVGISMLFMVLSSCVVLLRSIINYHMPLIPYIFFIFFFIGKHALLCDEHHHFFISYSTLYEFSVNLVLLFLLKYTHSKADQAIAGVIPRGKSGLLTNKVPEKNFNSGEQSSVHGKCHRK